MPTTRPDAALLRDIRLLIFDFDGVMTTNHVIVLQDGTEAVMCNRSDGLGVGLLQDLVKAQGGGGGKGGGGPELMVLSMEENPVVAARCKKLKLACIQGQKDKGAALTTIAADKGVSMAQIAYVGNDLNDVPCLSRVGLPIAVADAWPEALAHAKVITTRSGGYGAVREVCDWFRLALLDPLSR
jgi:3-deoxy-D-manno-octulosonate 8-phosphate phosphatase (KDO 8-P phosphatase)